MHPDRPPDIDSLLTHLDQQGVRFIIAGSVAAKLHGVELTPGDLDIVPAMYRANLDRLVRLLRTIEAQPKPGAAGHWEAGEDGEQHWVAEDPPPGPWHPDAADPSTLDHLFLTQHGNLDVVPSLMGDYPHLAKRAVERTCSGCPVRVAHIDDQLATLTVPRRQKDRPRVQALRALQGTSGEA